MADVSVNVTVPALEKLLDYAASGIGAVAGPMLATWKASKEAEAKRITTQADADAQIAKAKADANTLQIIADAQLKARQSFEAVVESGHGTLEISRDSIQQRIEFQERKRLANVRSVVKYAAEELADKEVKDHDPDPDWTARLFDGVQDVSSEDLQKIWGKILSGEVETPGRTSLRTLSVLRDMSQSDANALLKCAEYRISSFLIGDFYQRLSGDEGGNHLVRLQEIGLIHPNFGVSVPLQLDANGRWTKEYQGQLLLIEGSPGTNLERALMMRTTVFTRTGLELAKFCESQPNFEYLALFAEFLQKKGCALKSAPIAQRHPDGQIFCRTSDLRTIDPS